MPELRYAHVGSTTYNLRDDRLDTVEDSGAEFISRTATHDGAATIETMRGNTIVWNQLNANSTSTSTNSGVTFTKNGDGSWTVTGVASANADKYPSGSGQAGIVVGHKYLLRGCPSGGSASTYYMAAAGMSGLDTGSGVIGTAAATYGMNIRVMNGTDVGTLTFWPQLFDLTLMFGAGNEPATVAEFEALYPEAYYAYDAGSLLPVNVEGMTSTGTGWTQTRAIDPAYMPLRKAGSVYDELTATKLTRRVGAVDLGSLTWSYSSSWAAWYSPRIADVEGAASNTDYPSIKHATLPVILPNDAMYPSYTDDGVSCQVRQSDGARILVKNGSSSIQPTGTLYYEKHTPTETTISPALNLSYRVENGGTETWEPPSGEMTAPVDTDVAYGWLSVLAAYVQS